MCWRQECQAEWKAVGAEASGIRPWESSRDACGRCISPRHSDGASGGTRDGTSFFAVPKTYGKRGFLSCSNHVSRIVRDCCHEIWSLWDKSGLPQIEKFFAPQLPLRRIFMNSEEKANDDCRYFQITNGTTAISEKDRKSVVVIPAGACVVVVDGDIERDKLLKIRYQEKVLLVRPADFRDALDLVVENSTS